MIRMGGVIQTKEPGTLRFWCRLYKVLQLITDTPTPEIPELFGYERVQKNLVDGFNPFETC